jgi:hypothetical protein
MAAENEFLTAAGAYLTSMLGPGSGFAAAAKTVGIAEPGDIAELPALVLSLAATAGQANGLGGARALIAGTLRLDVCALQTADVTALSAAAVEALAAPDAGDAIHRLLRIAVAELGSVGAPEPPLGLRRRPMRFGFAFESQNLPVDPGGVIRTITIDTGLSVVTADRATGVISSVETSLPDEEIDLGA